MPLLPDPISQPNTKHIYLPKPDKDADGKALPTDQRAWVKMDVRPFDGEDTTRLSSEGLMNPTGRWLTRRITDWNFIDESGTKVPITYDNVMRIGSENLLYLSSYPLESVDALTDEQKKTFISTSTP